MTMSCHIEIEEVHKMRYCTYCGSQYTDTAVFASQSNEYNTINQHIKKTMFWGNGKQVDWNIY